MAFDSVQLVSVALGAFYHSATPVYTLIQQTVINATIECCVHSSAIEVASTDTPEVLGRRSIGIWRGG